MNCENTNIPHTDETSMECCELTPTNCVVLSEAVPCFRTGKGKTLTELLKKICSYFNELLQRVEALEENDCDCCNDFYVEVSEGEPDIEGAVINLISSVNGNLTGVTYQWSFAQHTTAATFVGSTTDPTVQVEFDMESLFLETTLVKLVVTNEQGCRAETFYNVSTLSIIGEL